MADRSPSSLTLDQKNPPTDAEYNSTRTEEMVTMNEGQHARSPTNLPQKLSEMQDGYRVVQRSTFHSVMIVVVVTISNIINIGNNTSVSIALPTMGREFQANETLMQWVVSAYSLSSGCLLLAFGRLADLRGRKKAFLLGTFVLAAFTLGVGLSNNMTTAIVLRACQGIGGAATIPASLGILAHAFPPSRARTLAFAAFASGAPIGAAFGTTFGGVLTQVTAPTWRSVYFLFAGINVICLLGGILYIDKDTPHPKNDKNVDWLGAFLVTAGLTLILFVLGEGEVAPHKWSTGYIIALLVVGVLLVFVFAYWQYLLEKVQDEKQQLHVQLDQQQEANKIQVQDRPPYLVSGMSKFKSYLPPPLMKPSLWKRANYTFAVTMAIAFMSWCSFVSWTFWVMLYYQDYLGISALLTVLRLLPMFVVGLLCTVFVGFVAGFTPMVVLMTVGTAGAGIACLLFAVINPKATYWAFAFPASILSVFGADVVFTSGTLYVAKIALPHEQSLASALFLTMTQLGTSAGVTVSTVAFNRVGANLAPGADPVVKYQAAQWTSCAFGLLGALLSLIFFRGVGAPGHNKVKPSGDTLTDPERGVESSQDDEKVGSGQDDEKL